MRIILIGFATMVFSIACGQKAPVKFGDIPMEDMLMKVYPQDSSASAVVLAEYGIAYISLQNKHVPNSMQVEQIPTLNFERIKRVKILTKDGLGYADASIALFHTPTGEESLTGLKAVTYNLENGKIVETRMSKDAVFTEKFNRYVNLKKFSLPNVKEGSVIEYSYTVRSDYILNFPNWQFQYSIPTRISEYWAMVPEFFVMEKFMQGYVATTEYKEDTRPKNDYVEKTFHWVIKDVPAFKEEPYMTSETDYISRVNFALSQVVIPGRPIVNVMSTWEKLTKDLLEDEAFGRLVFVSPYLKKMTEEIVGAETDQQKKTQLIYDFVRKQLEWNEIKDFTSENPKDVFEKKKGSSGDINLILASMLDKAGLDVGLVVLSTRDHGFIRQQYPMVRQLNYVVCMVIQDGKHFFLDATEKHLPLGVIPERCLNGQGLIVSPKSKGWIEVTSKTKARSVVTADFKLENSGQLKGSVVYTHDGYEALKKRKEIGKQGEPSYQNQVKAQLPTWNISTMKIEDVHELAKPVKTILELSIDDHVDVQGQTIYINPFVNNRIINNPFVRETRLFPVDFGRPEESIYMCKLVLPEGYIVDELPANRVLSIPNGLAKYTFSITPNGSILNVFSNFQINRNLFSQEEYPLLREFYNQVVAKQAEQIVLKKK